MATTIQIRGQISPVEDRRACRRGKIDQLVYVSLGPDNGGFLLDVSEGGLTCRVVGALIQGETCRPKFVLPGTDAAIEADCHILWTNESRKVGGLKFLSLPEEECLRIRGWIAQASIDVLERRVVAPTRMNPIEFGPKAIAPQHESSADGDGKQAVVTSEVANITPQTIPLAKENKTQPGAIPPPGEMHSSPKSVDNAAALPDPLGIRSQPRLPERDILSQPNPKTYNFSTAKVAAVIGLLAASLVLAYHFGRILGFESEAARLSTVGASSAPIAQPKIPAIDPDLPARTLDPSVPDAGLQAQPDSNGASNPNVLLSSGDFSDRAGAAQSHPSVSREADANQTKGTLASDKALAPSLNPITPPHVGKRPAAEPNSNPVMPSQIVPANAATLEPRTLPLSSVGNSTPAKPQERVAEAPAFFQGPVLTQRVNPEYPASASDSGIEGIVEVSAMIGKDGSPRELAVLKGDPRLSGAALDAIRKWRYQPALSGTDVVEAPVLITIQFRIQK